MPSCTRYCRFVSSHLQQTWALLQRSQVSSTSSDRLRLLDFAAFGQSAQSRFIEVSRWPKLMLGNAMCRKTNSRHAAWRRMEISGQFENVDFRPLAYRRHIAPSVPTLYSVCGSPQLPCCRARCYIDGHILVSVFRIVPPPAEMCYIR
jgi:hypothetical protein